MGRCEHSTGRRQCEHDAIPGTRFCDQHTSAVALRRQEARNYYLDKAYAGRLTKLANAEQIYSLREEIGLTRLILADLTAKVNLSEPTELAIHLPTVLKTAETLERLVKTSSAVEAKLGNTLSKSTVQQLGGRLVEILHEELSGVADGELIVERVTQRFADEISGAKDQE